MDLLSVNDQARDYISQKGGIAHLVAYRQSSMCCGKIGFPPSIQLGAPKNKEDYTLHQINTIQFYLPKDFSIHCPLTIGVHQTFGISSLHIDGWKLV